MTHVLNMSAKALQFYEKGRGRGIYSGYERNVLVRPDYPEALFVNSDYVPQPGDYIFRCDTMNQASRISLKTYIQPSKPLDEIALQGKFTKDEWMHILKAMNGVLSTPELDPREEIAGEVEDEVEISPERDALVSKIRGLDKLTGHLLLQVITEYWNAEIELNQFIERFL